MLTDELDQLESFLRANLPEQELEPLTKKIKELRLTINDALYKEYVRKYGEILKKRSIVKGLI